MKLGHLIPSEATKVGKRLWYICVKFIYVKLQLLWFLLKLSSQVLVLPGLPWLSAAWTSSSLLLKSLFPVPCSYVVEVKCWYPEVPSTHKGTLSVVTIKCHIPLNLRGRSK